MKQTLLYLTRATGLIASAVNGSSLGGTSNSHRGFSLTQKL